MRSYMTFEELIGAVERLGHVPADVSRSDLLRAARPHLEFSRVDAAAAESGRGASNRPCARRHTLGQSTPNQDR